MLFLGHIARTYLKDTLKIFASTLKKRVLLLFFLMKIHTGKSGIYLKKKKSRDELQCQNLLETSLHVEIGFFCDRRNSIWRNKLHLRVYLAALLELLIIIHGLQVEFTQMSWNVGVQVPIFSSILCKQLSTQWNKWQAWWRLSIALLCFSPFIHSPQYLSLVVLPPLRLLTHFLRWHLSRLYTAPSGPAAAAAIKRHVIAELLAMSSILQTGAALRWPVLLCKKKVLCAAPELNIFCVTALILSFISHKPINKCHPPTVKHHSNPVT